jgi:integrase
MSGHLVERGPNRWAIVLETYVGGRRKQKWHSFRGTKRDAQKRLAQLVTEREQGTYVEPSKQMVATYFADWLRDWAPVKAGPKTLEGYALYARYITDAIGDRQIQKVQAGDLNRIYLDLRERGLSPRTVKHTHVFARRVFGHALKQGDIKVDPSTKVDAPKVPHVEAAALRPEEIPVMLDGLRGTVLYPIAVVGLGTGLRRGELLALRWIDVDLDGAKLEVKRSLENTHRSLRFKEPKSARGRRTVTLSPSVVDALRQRRKEQLELRVKLGQGKPPEDLLVFTTFEGNPRKPDRLSANFSDAMQRIGLPHISLHSLRHTHASMLIKAGEDILTISRRLGHSSASITLNVYGHLMSSRDRAADIVEAMLKQ